MEFTLPIQKTMSAYRHVLRYRKVFVWFLLVSGNKKVVHLCSFSAFKYFVDARGQFHCLKGRYYASL